MIKNIRLEFRGKKLSFPVRETYFFGKFFGLMFKQRETENLLFNLDNNKEKGIHSFFVFFDFLAIWLDGKNRIVDYRIVKPFTSYVKPVNSFRKIIELPLNEKNKKIIEFFVGGRKV